jgi:alkylhydroperoxidase family enzyme
MKANSPPISKLFSIISSPVHAASSRALRVWVNSPAFAEPAQKLGAFCRYGTRLPARLSELVILTVGAHWRSGVKWHVHAPIAAREGVAAEVIGATHAGRAIGQFDISRLANWRKDRMIRAIKETDGYHQNILFRFVLCGSL